MYLADLSTSWNGLIHASLGDWIGFFAFVAVIVTVLLLASLTQRRR